MKSNRILSFTFSSVIIAILLSVYLLGAVPTATKAESAGWALSFDGVNDYATLNRAANIFHPNWKNEKSVVLWTRPHGPGEICPNNNVAWCDNIFGDRPRWWGISRGIVNGQDRIWVWNMSSNYNLVGIEYTPGEWVNIGLVHTGGVLYAFKNGVQVGSVPSTTTQQPSTGALPILQIGGVINNPQRVWVYDGEIDEVRLWNRALTGAEITADLYHSLVGNENDLAAYYKMSDGSGTILTDDSIYSWNGVLYDGGGIIPPNGAPPQWVVSDAFANSGVTDTPTATFTNTPTFTPVTPTNTPTITDTPGTPTNTPTPTFTPTFTATFTPVTPTNTSTSTPVTPTNTPTATSTPGSGNTIFADDFESGGLTAWSSSVTDGTDLSASQPAALTGAYGLSALINSTNPIYVRDDLPNAETHYRAAFWFDPNGLAMADRNHHIIFQGLTASNSFPFRVEFQRQTGEYWVRLAVLNDANAWSYTPWTVLSDAPHRLEVEWTASTAAGANNGSASFTLDGLLTGTISSLDTDTFRLEQVRLGPVSGIDNGTSGTYYFDGFDSFR